MKNKNLLFLLASLLSIAIIAGCKGEKASAAENVKDSVTSPSLIANSVVKKKDVPLVVDSIGKSYSTEKVDVDLAYSFPVSGPQPLVDSLRAYLSSEMVWVGDSYSDEDVESKPYSNFADGKGMINYYAKNAYKSISKTLDEIDDPEVDWKPAISMFVMKLNEMDRYVTFYSTFYTYSGGAHGMASEYGATFDKKTGVMLRNVLNPKDVKALQPILRAGVESYFSRWYEKEHDAESRVKTDMDALSLENGIIPLPGSGVYLSPEGVVFIYGLYEIGAYAIGMPTFTIPYKKIGKFLSPEARHLAGIK